MSSSLATDARSLGTERNRLEAGISACKGSSPGTESGMGAARVGVKFEPAPTERGRREGGEREARGRMSVSQRLSRHILGLY